MELVLMLKRYMKNDGLSILFPVAFGSMITRTRNVPARSSMLYEVSFNLDGGGSGCVWSLWSNLPDDCGACEFSSSPTHPEGTVMKQPVILAQASDLTNTNSHAQ
jgi:hypothetical protein